MNHELSFLGIGIFAISLLMITPSNYAEAAVDMFLKIEGIEGESQDKDHSGWIEISSVSYAISGPTTSTPSGGATTSKAEFSDVSITKVLDKASQKLAVSTASGDHYPDATIDFCDSSSGTCYFKLLFRNVIISSYSFSSGGDLPMEAVSLTYDSIKWIYKPKGTDGTDSSGDVETGWDIVENKIG